MLSSEASRGEVISRSYLELYKAALSGDWETAKKIFDEDKDAVTAPISTLSETTLSVAVFSGEANKFVRKLVDMLPPEALRKSDDHGNTALHNAAKVGNIEAAKILVTKNPELLYILSKVGRLPIVTAAIYCQKEAVEYLITMSKPNVENNPFQGQIGVYLLNSVIGSEFFDVAMDLIENYSDLARLISERGGLTPLLTMSDMATVFLSGERFSWWEQWIYHRVPLKQNKFKVGDIEDGSREAPVSNKGFRIFCGGSISFYDWYTVSQKLEVMLWKIVQRLVPHVEEIRKKKAVNQQAFALVKRLCQEILVLPEATTMFTNSITKAAMNGISEIVEVIMDMYPLATHARDSDTNSTIFLLAAKFRYEKVFNLFYSLSGRRCLLFDSTDNEGNNLMHLCGKLAPPHRLNLVRGPALQMQRELQWYNEVENFVNPSRRIWPNYEKKTPQMLFTEEHQKLKEDGEKWMKDTSNACTITAALIATVVFAAAFTVPGGFKSDNTGVPVFWDKFAFALFAISDAVSLFTAITSLLMFVSILTSRYAEEDFLYLLPKRLSIGLLCLFISITFMVSAFTATLYLLFRRQVKWFLIVVAASACLPVTSFMLLQFPLLLDVLYSTYGPSIFGNRNKLKLY